MNDNTLKYYYGVARSSRKNGNAKRYESVIKLLNAEAGNLRLSAKSNKVGLGLKKIILDRVHSIETEIRKIEKGQ